ncbi:MAG TPA: hopanoid-associated sugar epimerase [Stellaceae bacterium]|nr:hopanoid-associated sugar epimerase [Stellaceae bacterium]
MVTGASGFVGAAVARALLARGRKLRVLVRPRSDRRNIAGLAVEPRIGSLEDGPSLAAALDGCGALYHVAADYRLWVRDERVMYRANVDGTRLLMEAALTQRVASVVYTSSVAVLGIIGDGTPSDETTPSTLADMIGPYKRSKFLAEEVVRDLVKTRGLPAVIVNPSTPVGPGDVKPTPTGRVIVDAASGKMPAFVDTGLNIVHVDDVAAGHLLAEERGALGERHILGGEDLTLAEILKRVALLTGRKPPTIRLPIAAIWPIAVGAEAWARLTDKAPLVTRDELSMAKKKMFFSSAKAERALGYRARPAQQALADAVAYFRQMGMCP